MFNDPIFNDPMTDALLNALAKPNEFSDHCTPDGTPLTNFEYYKKLKEFN